MIAAMHSVVTPRLRGARVRAGDFLDPLLLIQRLGRIEPRSLQRDGDPAALAVGVLLGQEPVDRLEGGELAALEAAERVVERLQGAGHALQAGADAVEHLGHDAAPPPARRRPTAS